MEVMYGGAVEGSFYGLGKECEKTKPDRNIRTGLHGVNIILKGIKGKEVGNTTGGRDD